MFKLKKLINTNTLHQTTHINCSFCPYRHSKNDKR